MFVLFNSHLESKTKLIEENSTPPYRVGPLARVHMGNFHLTWVGSRQNQARSHLGGLDLFSYEDIFLKEFLNQGEISPRQASPPDRVSSPP